LSLPLRSFWFLGITGTFHTSKWSNLRFHHIRKDVTELMISDLSHSIDYVIHSATSTSTEGEDVPYLARTLICGTTNFCMLMSKVRPKGVLYLSSGAVYGLKRKSNVLISESTSSEIDLSSANEAYGIFKMASEKIFTRFYSETNIPVTIARCFTFSGPNLNRDHFAINSFIKQALGSGTIQVNSDGKSVRSYMDEEDLSSWLLTILQLNTGLDILNIGSENKISINELAHVIMNLSGAKTVEILKNNTDYNFYVPSTEYARNKYGLSSQVSLERSIGKMLSARKLSL